LIGGLALLAFSRTYAIVFLGTPRDGRIGPHHTPASMNAAMLLLCGACLGVTAGLGLVLPALSAAIRPFVSDAQAASDVVGGSLSDIARFTPALLALTLLAVGLFVWRQRMLREAKPVSTWGCGFSSPRASMQYTGSSYSWSLIHAFRHVVRPKRCVPAFQDGFPDKGGLSTHTADVVLDRVYQPLFRGLAAIFERLWPLQHGRIQLYLVYVVATVLVVFLIEGLGSSPGVRSPAAIAKSTRPTVRLHADGSVPPGDNGNR
jgi:hypothetical protein